MKTYQVDPALYADKEPLAVGYKIFNWDWTGQGEYCYAHGEKSLEGSVHAVDGELKPCEWGLHFSTNPLDCMKFKAPVQWMRFAKVSAFDEILEHGQDKTIARTLRIDKVLTWNEFIDACKTVPKKILEGQNGVRGSHGVSYSNGVRGSDGVSYSNGVSGSSGVSYSYGVSYSNGVSGSSGVSYSNGVRGSSGVSYSYGVHYSNGVSGSSGVSYSNGVRGSDGVSGSDGACRSKYCKECEGISRCIFAYKESGKLLVFNKPVSEGRFNKLWADIARIADGWYPNFTNAEELRQKSDGQAWKATPADMITGREDKEAYADMPKALEEYIKALPEYDEEIFNAVTGRHANED